MKRIAEAAIADVEAPGLWSGKVVMVPLVRFGRRLCATSSDRTGTYPPRANVGRERQSSPARKGDSLGRDRSLNRKLDSDAITLLGAPILQIIGESLEKVNAQAARLDLFQRPVDQLYTRLCQVEGSTIVFDGQDYSVRKNVDGD